MPLRVTVPVELFPAFTLVGFRVSEERVGPEEPEPDFTVKLVDTVAPPDCAKTGGLYRRSAEALRDGR